MAEKSRPKGVAFEREVARIFPRRRNPMIPETAASQALEAPPPEGWRRVGRALVHETAQVDGHVMLGDYVAIHKHAVVERDARLEAGATVFAGAFVGRGACVGRNAMIREGAHVGAGAIVDVAAHVGPGATIAKSGRVAPYAQLGPGARVGRGGLGTRHAEFLGYRADACCDQAGVLWVRYGCQMRPLAQWRAQLDEIVADHIGDPAERALYKRAIEDWLDYAERTLEGEWLDYVERTLAPERP